LMLVLLPLDSCPMTICRRSLQRTDRTFDIELQSN
jgi:hypothetical protein